jgi:hypothetical protein
MLYKLLGMVVWKGGKLALRQRYGSTYVSKLLLAGVVLAAVAGVALLVVRHNASED